MINLDAPILPAKSSAGFRLGEPLNKILLEIGDIQEWNGTPQLAKAIYSSTRWLLVNNSSLSNAAQTGCSLHSPSGVVALDFNANDILSSISVFHGYRGLLFDYIKVGDALEKLRAHVMTDYDEGDELHYAVPTDSIQGVAFYADEDTLERSPNQIIRGISVFIPSAHEYT